MVSSENGNREELTPLRVALAAALALAFDLPDLPGLVAADHVVSACGPQKRSISPYSNRHRILVFHHTGARPTVSC